MKTTTKKSVIVFKKIESSVLAPQKLFTVSAKKIQTHKYSGLWFIINSNLDKYLLTSFVYFYILKLISLISKYCFLHKI